MKINPVLPLPLLNTLNDQSIPVMKKIFICIISIFLSSSVYAQQPIAEIENQKKTSTLFDYGSPVNTIEDNFKNLFRNFPLLVSNAGQGLKLTSYQFLTTIKEQKEAQLYLRKNTKVYESGVGIVSAFGGNEIENNKIRVVFPPEQLNKRIEDALSKEITDNIEKAAKNIHTGDEVYIVNFMADGTKYDFYVFVNPKSKTVLKEGNFLGFSIPLYYADFYSKRK